MGFFSNLVGFENSFSKDFTKDIFHSPTRLLTGIDPASTKVWNTVLGRDDKPLVNVYGSPGQQYYDQAQADGIDTGAAQQFHGVADKIASYYGMQGLSGIGGAGAGAGSGAASSTGSGGSGMGFMDSIGGSNGSGWGSLIGGVLGAIDSNKQPDSQVTQNKIDPRLEKILFGDKNNGLLSQYQGLLYAPQSDVSKTYAGANGDYLSQYGGKDLGAIRDAALGLMGGNAAPQSPAALTGAATASLPSYAVGNTVNAPTQNSMDLSGTFKHLMSPGDNQALRDSLAYGTQLTGAQFQKNQTDLTNNLMRNVLPGIQGGAIAAGQYGGTRQGIAQGNALSDFTNQLTSSNTQMGLGSSANTSAQLGADYQQSQNRALSAAQSLSAQQYGVAQQDANTKNQAEFMNVGNQFDVSKFNASNQQQANLANLGTTHQTNMANQNAQLQTRQQNNAGAATGAGLLGGLLGQTSGVVNGQDNYALTRAQGVNGLMVPYLSANQSQSTPLYTNKAGNIMGGMLAGSQLAGMFGGMSGGTSGGASSSLSGMQGNTYNSAGNYAPSAGTFDWGSLSNLFSGS